nr:transposase [Streptomyces scabiei]
MGQQPPPVNDRPSRPRWVNQSPWDPLPVRRRIAERLSGVVGPEVWVIDDVSFPKCGSASVGVARQYCGAVGKRANCQVAVSALWLTGFRSRCAARVIIWTEVRVRSRA